MKNHKLSGSKLFLFIAFIGINLVFSSYVPSVPPTISPTTATITTSSGKILTIDIYRKTDNHAKSPSVFSVEVTIKKENLNGSTKLTETLPPGFSATVIESQDASFSFVNQKATFVWTTLPSMSEFKISYKVSVAANISGMQTIEGVFYFVENDRTMKFVLPHTSVNIIDPSVNQLIAAVSAPKTPAVAPKAPVVDYYQIKKSNGSKKIPIGNIYYKVQFLALYQSSTITNTTVPIVLDSIIGEPYETRLTQGFLQYTIGPFNTFDEATKHKEEMVLKGYPGSFIKAYMNKRRITIKEARAIQEAK